MELAIKNMVCPRCILAVKQAAASAGLSVKAVTLGSVSLAAPASDTQLAIFDKALEDLGFERLQDSRQQLVNDMKSLIIKQVHYETDAPREKLSVVLAKALLRDYSFLSHLFSEQEGITIEQFAIQQRIEKAKELLSYGELTLSEIAWQLQYSSVAHLSAQFKKVTGMTPSTFKAETTNARRSLDF